MQPLVKSKVMDIELCRPLASITGLDGYKGLQGLVRLHGVPIGYVQLPVHSGHCSASEIGQTILTQHSWTIIRHLLCDALAAPPPLDGWCVAEVLTVPHPVSDAALPVVTVTVCTRDRTADLARCLEALCRLEYPALDLLVIDNAPSSDATERLVHTSYPSVRYVCEPRPGLDWARNRAILEARGEIIAYTDDDVVVDAGWVRALADVFVEHPEVMAVTGLVVPYELETEAQLLMERYGGFGRGFERRWYRVDRHSGERVAAQHGGAGKFGTGANMAYRRGLFDHIGAFDPALGVGTITHGGDDHEMFFRVLKAGHTLVYEPNAVVYHRHRQDYASLRTQIMHNGIGLYAYFVRNVLAYPDERLAFIRLGLWWLWRWHIRRLLISLAYPFRFPRDLILAELRGACVGVGCYPKARAIATRIAEAYSALPQPVAPPAISSDPQAMAVRTWITCHPVPGVARCDRLRQRPCLS